MAPVTRLVIGHLIDLFANASWLFSLDLWLEFILKSMRVIRGLEPIGRFLAISWFLRLSLRGASASGSLTILGAKEVVRIGFSLIEGTMSLKLVIRFQKFSIHSVEESLKLGEWESLLVKIFLGAQYIGSFEWLNYAFLSVRQELLDFWALSNRFDFQRFDIFFPWSDQTDDRPFLLT